MSPTPQRTSDRLRQQGITRNATDPDRQQVCEITDSANEDDPSEDENDDENEDENDDEGEQPETPDTPATKSLIQKYFDRLLETEQAVCKTCKKEFSTPGNTTSTTLTRHLKRRHKKLHKLYKEERAKVLLALSQKSKTRFKKPGKDQPKISDAFKKITTFSRDNKQARAITRKILEMIPLDYQPISIVEDKGFKSLINLLEPRYVLPSRKWLSSTGLPNLYQEIRQKIQEEIETDLSEIQTLSFTVDGWSSRSKEGYLSLTIQYVDKTFHPKTFTLQCKHFPGEHNADAIYNKVKEMIASWGIDIEDHMKDMYVVSDCAPNMVSAFTNQNVIHIKCAVHVLQTVITDSLKESDKEIDTLLSKCRHIVGHYNHSNKSHARLQQVQKRLGLPEHELIQSVDTRWNSTYLMLNRLKEQKDALCVDMPKVGKIANKTIELTNEDWDKIEDLSTVLAPVYEATLELGSEDCPTLSMVLPIVSSIQQTLTSSLQNSNFAKKLKGALLRNSRSRFVAFEHENHYVLATVLDPRFKLAMFEQRQSVTAKTLLKQKTSSRARVAAREEADQEEEATAAEDSPEKFSLWNILKDRPRLRFP